MANRCYLELYVPASSLEGDVKKYWDNYIKNVIPRFQDIFSLDENVLKETIVNTFGYFDESKYPLIPYTIIDGECYVYNGDTVSFKHCIPDQFIACFDNEDTVKSNINIHEYKTLNENDKSNLHDDYNFFRLDTTISKAKKLLEKNLEEQDKELNKEYIEFGNYLLDLFSNNDDKSIVSLFSGEIFFYGSVDDMISYIPS